MEPSEICPPDMSETPEDATLMNEMVSVLKDAKHGLTEDDILAVIAIRKYRAIVSALEDLILMGQIGAERHPDVRENAPVTIRSFIFYGLSDDDRAQLRSIGKKDAGDALAF